MSLACSKVSVGRDERKMVLIEVEKVSTRRSTGIAGFFLNPDHFFNQPQQLKACNGPLEQLSLEEASLNIYSFFFRS